jgi:hypothetical protein
MWVFVQQLPCECPKDVNLFATFACKIPEYETTGPQVSPYGTIQAPGPILVADFWGHPRRGPDPLINQLIWAIDTDRNIEVDYVKMALTSDNDVSGLDIEMGNPIFMKKCDAVHQLPTEISNLAMKVAKVESKIERGSFRNHDERPHTQVESSE